MPAHPEDRPRRPDPAVLAALQARIAGVTADHAVVDDSRPPADAVLPDGGGAAMAFLTRSTAQRPLTVAEARDKLQGKGHDTDVVDAVVARAVAVGMLDDAAFAAAWVNDRGVNRGYGRSRLVRELRRRQVPDVVIDDALQQLDGHDEEAQATDLAEARARRMPATLEPEKVASRLVGFLVRRGYPSGVAHRVARQVSGLDRAWD